jgi:hypothetical protein
MKLTIKWTTLAILFTFTAVAQQPRFSNASVETRTAGNLSAIFQSVVAATEAPAWIAWTVPSVKSPNASCGWDKGGYRGSNKLMLEGSTTLVVLFRIEHKAVDKMRTAALECEIDGGGLPVLLLTGVRPADSVAVLEPMGKIEAIAMHDDPAADASLERFSAPGQPMKVREKLGFALAAFRGKRGFEMLRRFNANEPDDRVREKNMFGFSVSTEPQALDLLIDAAKNDKSPRVRSQALFWMAQKAGDRQKAAIRDAVENDPEVEVKKKGVFALNQLPESQGVPLLIELARTNKSPEVRKRAMFWLGQSKDPRALTYIQEVLGR